MASEAFRLGASAYLLKTSAGSELIRALREVMRGGTYVTPLMTEGMVGSVHSEFQTTQNRQPTYLASKGSAPTAG